MSVQRKPEDAVPVLLRLVSEAKARAAVPNRRTSGHLVLFGRIEGKLEEMKNLFPAFKQWEKIIMESFAELEQDIDDDVFDDRGPINKIKEHLESIDGKLEVLKNKIDKIQLPPIDDERAKSAQQVSSASQARKMSEDWLQLRLEERILVSPGIASLQVSYDILDLQLKLCLLCFSIFPENSVIKKTPLIYWWIGESLITRTKDKSAEEEGEVIFQDLINKGLIQPVLKNNNPVVDRCTMHPWMRRMLISVAGKSGFFNFDSKGNLGSDLSRFRRACLISGERGFSSTHGSKEEELLTLFNVNEQYIRFNAEWLLKSRKVVVLQLGRWQNLAKHHIEVENADFFNHFRGQKHLRYLSLQGISRITTIPSSIFKLRNLEILDLRACHNLEKLPSDISSLRKLTHLDISECFLLEGMPRGLEKLSSLQVFKGYVIGTYRRTSRLSDLAHLRKLRKLSIYIRSDAIVEDGELGKLKESASLRVLTISWGRVLTITSVSPVKKDGARLNRSTNVTRPDGPLLNRVATLTMKSFAFPQKLEKLDLRCFPRRMTPDWLKPSALEDLKKLYIRGGDLDNLNNPEGNKKWKVEILRLKYLKNLKIQMADVRRDFPELIYFEKVQCHQITESQYDEDVVINKFEKADN